MHHLTPALINIKMGAGGITLCIFLEYMFSRCKIKGNNSSQVSACFVRAIDTYIHTYIHTLIHAYMHTYMHTCMPACVHACLHAYPHDHVQVNVHMRRCLSLDTLMHKYTRACATSTCEQYAKNSKLFLMPIGALGVLGIVWPPPGSCLPLALLGGLHN